MKTLREGRFPLRRHATSAMAVAVALLLWIGSDHAMAAMTRTSRPRLHATAERRPVALHVSRSARRASVSERSSRTKRTEAARPASSRAHVRETKAASRATVNSRRTRAVLVKAPARRRPIPMPEERAAVRSKAPAHTASATLTANDFMRAAQGTSHPDEMDDEEAAPALPPPEKVLAAARDLPRVTAPASPAPSALATNRVDGFGAEGAALPHHRTLAGTMAAHPELAHGAVAPLPKTTPAERIAITEEAIKPVVLPALYSKDGRLMMPAALKGSHDVLVHQNTMADADGLERIQNDADLARLERLHELVRLPESSSLEVNEDIPVERRYARPWTVRFATELARAYAARFGEPIRINSAVRTVAYQMRLMRVNGNAASISGETASPHLTGQAFDIGKRGMSNAEIAWMRAYLGSVMHSGSIDVEEEFQQACFHISVYRAYMETAKKLPRMEVAAADASEKEIDRTTATVGAVVASRP